MKAEKLELRLLQDRSEKMRTKPSWTSLLDLPKSDADFLNSRPPIIAKRCCMNGKIGFDGKNHYVVIPQKLLDRANLKIGDEVEVSGESLGLGYRITVERAPAHEQEGQQDA